MWLHPRHTNMQEAVPPEGAAFSFSDDSSFSFWTSPLNTALIMICSTNTRWSAFFSVCWLHPSCRQRVLSARKKPVSSVRYFSTWTLQRRPRLAARTFHSSYTASVHYTFETLSVPGNSLNLTPGFTEGLKCYRLASSCFRAETCVAVWNSADTQFLYNYQPEKCASSKLCSRNNTKKRAFKQINLKGGVTEIFTKNDTLWYLMRSKRWSEPPQQ